VSSVFHGDNIRKKSLGEKPLNPPIASNFVRKSSVPSKHSQTSSVQNVSPISSHRGSGQQSLKPGLLKQPAVASEQGKFDMQFAQQIHQKLQMQQQ